MLGAIVGDIAGSTYEPRKITMGGGMDFPLFPKGSHFTDDTVLSVATADAIMSAVSRSRVAPGNFTSKYLHYGRRFPNAGYGKSFRIWLTDKNPTPYGSFGNGSAMRVSPVAWLYDDIEDVRKYAGMSSSVTHDHPEGIRGAMSVAEAVFMARKGASKKDIRSRMAGHYGYDMNRTLKGIKDAGYRFSSHAQTSVPEAIIAFLESEDFESAIRNAIWLGGDCDTQAAIAGAIAEAAYGGVPDNFRAQAMKRLDPFLTGRLELFQSVMPKAKENGPRPV